ncbi:sulfatase family protein [Confluentibacter lentus]|uniref:sulfatase family protein n=1 Tax=Confluentibacter lentus TaxID=1699412 RepID=UPI000C291A3D|nr:sulfatase [Confluentibacter lentus]
MKSTIFLSLCFFSLCGCLSSKKEEKQKVLNKPNLLIVLSDQHSYDMVGAYGNTQVITPNLDKFAQEGMLLKNSFSNQPVCTPFRGMLMSGMHPLKNGAFSNDCPLLPNNSILLAQKLKNEGYQTAYIGKWHLLGGERDRPIPQGDMRYGFDKLLTDNCHLDFRPHKSFFWNENGEKEFFDEWEVFGQTKQAISYLDTIDKTKPFALIVSWHPPHDWGKIEGEDGKMHYRYETLDEFTSLYNPDSIKVRPGINPSPDLMKMYHGHMSMISGIDKAFGMLMTKLKEKDLVDNTVTVFTADHGDMLESHGAILPKQYPYDYSNRTPFIIKYPKKIKHNTQSDVLFGVLDFLPTVLGFMDISSKQKYDGKDLSDALLTNNTDAVAYIPIFNFERGTVKKHSWRGVITKEFTYAIAGGENPLEMNNVLFDRKNDPYQLNNLFYNPEYKNKREELEKLAYDSMNTFNDKFYVEADFKRVEPKETWEYNYSKRPIDFFDNNN